ncbi:MAG: YggT family protein [Actinomycetota bacterium]|nr:YggT family protein [Actinomycetota bacterium]
MPLADAIDTAQGFVNTLFLVYLALIFLYIITSWVPLPYNLWLNRIQRFLYDVVEPYLRVFRRFLPQVSFGGLGLDLSPIIAIIVLIIANRVVQEGIELFR